MKLARFQTAEGAHIGKIDGDDIVDLTLALEGKPTSMRWVIERLEELRPEIMAATTPRRPLAEVTLTAPIQDPSKLLAIGVNYKAHTDEARAAGFDIPEARYQLWFNKQVSCINGPFAPIHMPIVSDQLDYEAELAVIIGKRCRHVRREDARSVIAGYMIINDVSVRDWQKRTGTLTLGKSFDTHGPTGPWITTDDEIADPNALDLWLSVNGERRQSSNTRMMIADIYDQITYLSTVMTLEPGDILATGTPEGVGLATGQFLRIGDVVRIEIEGLGAIENVVAPEFSHAPAHPREKGELV